MHEELKNAYELVFVIFVTLFDIAFIYNMFTKFHCGIIEILESSLHSFVQLLLFSIMASLSVLFIMLVFELTLYEVFAYFLISLVVLSGLFSLLVNF